MRACISVNGRFHAFYLAKQLEKTGNLEALISTYPRFEIEKYKIPSELIRSLWQLEILSRVLRRLPGNYQFFIKDTFDKSARELIPPTASIFIGWSSNCLYSLRRAKELGMATIVERGSSHMAYQAEILTEEYARWGLNFNALHPEVYNRAIQEYEIADCIAIPSLFVKQTFLDKGVPESKVIHVPYGVSLSEFYPVPKEDKTFRVIHCGGITLRKGVQYLLQAFYELNLPDAELWLVGTLSPEIKPFLKKYQSDRIILKGKHPQNKLRWFYSQCSVFCIASIEEGLAMVQPQAMACGLPVIHTTNTGGGDIVRDGVDGVCVPIRNVDALKEKILYFYENPDRRDEMGQNAIEQSKTSLSWDDYGNKIVAAYKEVISRI